MTNPIDSITRDTFADALAQPGVTVIDFWAGWCAPCRAIAPKFEQAARLRPQYRFGKIDVDAEPGLAATFGVRSIPTLIVLRDGEPIARHTGVVGVEQLVDALDGIAAATPAAGAAS